MKIFLFFILIVQLISAISLAQNSTNTSGDLTVIVNGLESEEGKVMIALSHSQEDYDTKGEPFRGGIADISDLTAIWTFKNIPNGTYALKVFHDEDEDNELDTNFIGIPSEDYGFSNDAKGSFGPASWEDAKFLFEVKSDTVVINIE